MTAPLINKRVRVTGTSREELNGKLGVAFGFDYDKNRYNVRLDGGKEVSLQPNNLEAVQGPSSGAGGIPSMPNMQGFSAAGNPIVAAAMLQAQQLLQRVQLMLPAGVNPGHAATGALVFVGPWYSSTV